MRKKWIIMSVIGVVLVGVATVGPIMSDVETPKYEVVDSEKNIEIRRYEPMIIAEVLIADEREDALREGFRLLADYIFGNNTVKMDIAMTAPVQQQSVDSLWRVSFVMPSKYSIETLPKANNDRIILKEIIFKKFVSITFSGTNSDENLRAHEKQLMEYVETNNILVAEFPKYAFYNPPWTLPPLRRNEVMIEMTKQ